MNTGTVPDRLTFALPPAERLGWLGPCGTTLTDEGRRQLDRLTTIPRRDTAVNDNYQAALAEYAAAKADLRPWIGKSGPAHQIIEMERRLEAAVWRLAELAYERDGK